MRALALFVLGGFLLGGAWSMHRQGAARGVVVLLAVSSLLAVLLAVALL